MAEFDRATTEAEYARADLGHHTQYLSPHLDLQLGIAAMAQGHTADASGRYQAALALAREAHLGDTGTVMFGEILAAELELERNVSARPLASPTVSTRLLSESGASHDIYAANVGVAAELAIASGAPDRALATVLSARDFARSTERTALATLLSAMRVSILVIAGRVEDARRAWHGDDLPGRDDACLDFAIYRWREVEAMACARLRLLIACADFKAARDLANRLDIATASRRLVRTRMRGLALSMRLESLAGCVDHAAAHLRTYLGLFTRADYARPLARERTVAVPLLGHVAETCTEETVATAARDIGDALAAAASPFAPTMPTLTARELDVLKRLEHHADGQIARDLNLTYDRVRYQVRRLFAKLGARSRLDAVHRARALGILPGPPL
ncbi:MAG: LuxR C-terminal-related transcriptional regulator [Gammaproteobacteria bacterium]|nr:LuxR C-terminal-related transcriptional regulator [Gammaproteobacteria bacterium]